MERPPLDDRGLAPLFGLPSSNAYVGGQIAITPIYTIRVPTDPLWRNISNPYVSSGYAASQTPSDGDWNKNELAGAQGQAIAPQNQSGVMSFSGAGYLAIYITSMPEYNGSTIDEQFLYNAITR